MKSRKNMRKKNDELNNNTFIKKQGNSRIHGITLVALVCTIVILLILAGITIAILFGENGIIKKAQDAGDATKNGQADEIEGLDSLEEQMIDAMYGGSKIEDWEYTLNEENGEVILNKYIGDNQDINIKGSYMIDNKSYKTVLGQTDTNTGSEKGPFYTAKIGRENIKKIRIRGGVTVENNNANAMFTNCKSLEDVDLKGLDTSNVKYMSGMFINCSSLKNLDISYLDTNKAEGTQAMFAGCIELKNLKLPDFSSGNLKCMIHMFADCVKLKEVDVSKINTSNIIVDGAGFLEMFANCQNLEKLDLSSWNMNSIICMINTFIYCTNLKEIDLSGSELSNLQVVDGLFGYTPNLTTIYVKTENDKTKLTNLSGPGNLDTTKCNIIVKGETTSQEN